MKRVLYFLCMLILAVSLAGPALAEGCKEMVAKADQAFTGRADMAKAKQAFDLYKEAFKAHPKCYEAAWKLAGTCYWIGLHSPEEERLAIYELGVNAAKKAVEINPDKPDGHYWLGVCYGRYGNAKGILESLNLVDPIKAEMAIVSKMDRTYNSGGPDRVLGRLYFKLPGLFGGDNDLALEHLRKSIEIGPQSYLSHIYLADVLIDEGEEEEAKKVLQQVIDGPAEPGLEVEDAEYKEMAKKKLKELNS